MTQVQSTGAGPTDVYESLPVPVLVADRAHRMIHANAAWRALFRAPAGANGRGWLLAFDVATRRRVQAYLRLVTKGVIEATEVPCGPGHDRWVELRAVLVDDADGARLVVVAVDVTGHRRRESDLVFDATHDPLTGIHNRAALLDKTEWAIARLDRQPSLLGLLFLDLDGFKDVNDRYGHRVGDQALVMVAARLSKAVRPADVLGRVGGDEFVVVCEALSSADEAQVLAERLVATIRLPLRVSESVEVTLGATVGVAVTDAPDETAAALIDRADRAMYHAKRNPGAGSTGPPGRDGLVKAGAHLSSFERDLREEWSHSLGGPDPDATRRWLAASDYVRRAARALQDESTV